MNLAQLDRVAAYEAVGQGFESLSSCQHILDKILGTSETSNILNKKAESVGAEQYERMTNGLLSNIKI